MALECGGQKLGFHALDLIDIFINKIRLEVDKNQFYYHCADRYSTNNYSKVWGR